MKKSLQPSKKQDIKWWKFAEYIRNQQLAKELSEGKRGAQSEGQSDCAHICL